MTSSIKTARLALRHAVISVGLWIARVSGIWRYPIRRNIYNAPEDRLAKLNWIYKSIYPVIHAEKGSGLEGYFRRQRYPVTPLLPHGFQPERVVRFSAAGDLMRAPGLENSRGKLYAPVAEHLFGADVSFANLESTVIPVESGAQGLYVNVSRAEHDAFKGHDGRQFTLVSTANNHILDGGVDGVHAVHKLLAADGMAYVGTNAAPGRRREGIVIESNGIRIGFVAATFGINHRPLPPDQAYLVNQLPFNRDQEHTDLSLLKDQIDWCHAGGCDFVIASLHWGHEFEFFPRRHQVQIAHAVIELGADALIGHHSHTIQPWEMYQTRRDPQRKAPIFYSLGNLVSWAGAAYRCLSLVAGIGLTRGRIAGETKTLVAAIDILPVLQLAQEANGEPYLQIDALRHLVRSGADPRVSRFVAEAAPYADLVLGEAWRDGKAICHGEPLMDRI